MAESEIAIEQAVLITFDDAARADMLAFLDERIQQAAQLSPEECEQAAAELEAFKQRLNENRALEPPLFV